ncbi:MAG: (2Fe-2S)-binding protein [Candidatus Aminicenantes bacterium]|nr:(2Fe-2S)-binding protein [Candidatus Aminicenantes bacterium]
MKKDLRIKKINRKEKVNIRVNGNEVLAYNGETVFAALVASGYKALKKSPILKEKRGAFCGMGVCFECLVTVNGTPNVRSCMCPVENDMEIEVDE